MSVSGVPCPSLRRAVFAVLLAGAGAPAHALEISGVAVPDRASVAGQTLALNGAGVRSRFFVRIYVGALYLPTPTREAAHAVSMPGPKRVAMHMLYDQLSAKQVTDAWRDGFESNLSPDALAALMPRIEVFNALWPALEAGDRVVLDFEPETGTHVEVNGTRLGTVAGKDFNEAMLRIWLGDAPVDRDLKRGMLGS